MEKDIKVSNGEVMRSMHTQRVMPEHRQKVAMQLICKSHFMIRQLKERYKVSYKQMASELEMTYEAFMVFKNVSDDDLIWREDSVVFKGYAFNVALDIKKLRNNFNYLELRVKLLYEQEQTLKEWKEL